MSGTNRLIINDNAENNESQAELTRDLDNANEVASGNDKDE